MLVKRLLFQKLSLFACEFIHYRAFRRVPWCEPPTSCMAWWDGTLVYSLWNGKDMVRSHPGARRRACSVCSYGGTRRSTLLCGPASCQPSWGRPPPLHGAAVEPNTMDQDPCFIVPLSWVVKFLNFNQIHQKKTSATCAKVLPLTNNVYFLNGTISDDWCFNMAHHIWKVYKCVSMCLAMSWHAQCDPTQNVWMVSPLLL